VEAADESLDVNDVVVTDSLSNPYTPSAVALVAGGTVLEIEFGAGLPDQKRYTIELAGKFEKAGTEVPIGGDTDCQVRGLVGDVNSDGSANNIDMFAVKARNGSPVGAANPQNTPFDLNTSGDINLIDMALARSVNGHSAP